MSERLGLFNYPKGQVQVQVSSRLLAACVSNH